MESSKGLRPAAEISTYFTSVQTRYNMRMIERLTVYVFLTAISTAPQSSSEQEPFAYCARGGGVTADEILGFGGRAQHILSQKATWVENSETFCSA